MTQGEYLNDAGDDDRRKDNRTTAVYRPVLLETEDFTGFCLLKNISSNGMMGMAYAQFAPGELVNVQFVPGHVVPGKIIWSEAGKIGVSFDEPIDLADSLKNMGSTYLDTWINRSPRLAIECAAEAEIGGHLVSIRLQDISQRGFKAVIPSIRPAEEVTVRLPGMEPRKAIVRWSQGDLAGLSFVRPIAFEVLARWAIERQSVAQDERAFG